MAEYWQTVSRNLKAGYSPSEIVDAYAAHLGVQSKVDDLRAQGIDDKRILQEIDPGVSKGPDPYAEASQKMGARRYRVPLGAALVSPVAGVRQMLGNEQAGQEAVEAQQGIERNIPGGAGGLLAGKAGVAAAMTAPFAGIGAGIAGMRGVATRAATAFPVFAAESATAPVAEGGSRAMNALKGGGAAMVATPIGEGAAAILSRTAQSVAQIIMKMRASSGAAASSSAASEAEIRAALRIQGVNYDALPQAMKQELSVRTTEALNPKNLSGDPMVRAALVEQQLGPEAAATLGQATRSTEQMLFEQQFGGEQVIRRQAAQAAALENKLKALSGKIGTTGEPESQGMLIQSATLKKEAAADDAIWSAYKEADESVGDVPVSADGLGEIINLHTPLTKGVDVLVAKLKKAGLKFDDNGDLVAGQSIPAKYMHEIRKVAVGMTTPGNQSAGVGRDIKRVVDETFLSSGIDKYKKAAGLAREGFAQFSDREIPAAITATRNAAGVEAMKSPSVITGWLMKMPPEKLSEFKRFLLTGNEKKLAEIYKANPAVKQSGVEGYRQLKSAAIDAVMNDAVMKSTVGESTQYIVSPDALVTAFNKIGEKRLSAVLDAKDFNNLKNIVRAAEIISTPGRSMMKGSAEANTALARRVIDLLGISGGSSVSVEIGGAVKGLTKSSAASKSIAGGSAEEVAKRTAKQRSAIVVPQKVKRVGAMSLSSLAAAGAQ